MAIEAGTSTYYQAKRGIVQDGLVLHLDAGVKESYSGGAVWKDISGKNNNITLYNGVIFDQTRGGELVFDGSNTYGYTDNVSLRLVHDSGEVSYEILSYPITSGALIFKGLANACRYEPQISGSGYCTFSGCGASGKAHDGNSSLLNNNYYMLTFCVSENGDYAKTYINGNLSQSTTITSIKQNSNQSSYILNSGSNGNALLIGCGITNNISNRCCFLSGSISMIRIYNRPLLENEITQNYNSTRHRFGI